MRKVLSVITILSIVIVLVNDVAKARHGHHLLTNRTPKGESSLSTTSDVCMECQLIIKRIVEVAKNPEKLEELKLLMNLLCEETKFKEECKLFVKRLDVFIDRLLPYMSDPHKLCKELKMCQNDAIDRFRQVAEFYASLNYPRDSVQSVKDVVCEECQFAAHELDELVQSKKKQMEVHDWISTNICAHLGKYRGSCDLLLEDFLPELFVELHYVLQDNRQFCVDLELCEPKPREQRQRELLQQRANSLNNRDWKKKTMIYRAMMSTLMLNNVGKQKPMVSMGIRVIDAE